MAYFLFKRWPEQLFYAGQKDIVFHEARIPVSFVRIKESNISLVRQLRGSTYEEQFRYQLRLGDFGYYAFYEEKPVAYGWVKHYGSDDYFYKIGEGICYLCRFFTLESYRGNGIYPALISKLILHEENCEHFYIDVETGNISSRRGLEKVGFRFVREYAFIRGFKHTFNKQTLCQNKKQ